MLDAFALADIDLIQVGIKGGLAGAVFDDDHIAITALMASELHHAVRHRHGWRTRGGGIIHAQVRTVGLKQGVKTHAKAAGHARKAHRCRQEGVFQALAI